MCDHFTASFQKTQKELTYEDMVTYLCVEMTVVWCSSSFKMFTTTWSFILFSHENFTSRIKRAMILRYSPAVFVSYPRVLFDWSDMLFVASSTSIPNHRHYSGLFESSGSRGITRDEWTPIKAIERRSWIV